MAGKVPSPPGAVSEKEVAHVGHLVLSLRNQERGWRYRQEEKYSCTACNDLGVSRVESGDPRERLKSEFTCIVVTQHATMRRLHDSAMMSVHLLT